MLDNKERAKSLYKIKQFIDAKLKTAPNAKYWAHVLMPEATPVARIPRTFTVPVAIGKHTTTFNINPNANGDLAIKW